jgi:colicin import membrane protein
LENLFIERTNAIRGERIKTFKTKKSAIQAIQEHAAMIATLEVKDQDEVICRYPTCNNLRQAATGTGRPSAYCDNTDHTPVSNHRARQQLRAAVAGGSSATPVKPEQASPVVPVESLRTTVVHGMQQLQTNLERYLSIITTLADPDLSAAQIQATLDQAQTRVAEAQQIISAERSLRLAAEIARTAAEAQAQEAHDAAESAIGRMEEVEARSEQQRDERPVQNNPWCSRRWMLAPRTTLRKWKKP